MFFVKVAGSDTRLWYAEYDDAMARAARLACQYGSKVEVCQPMLHAEPLVLDTITPDEGRAIMMEGERE